jgi:hypothetical protein
VETTYQVKLLVAIAWMLLAISLIVLLGLLLIWWAIRRGRLGLFRRKHKPIRMPDIWFLNPPPRPGQRQDDED